jgi:predicted RNase H-like HicB family nuclease
LGRGKSILPELSNSGSPPAEPGVYPGVLPHAVERDKKMETYYNYTAIIEKEDEGGFYAFCPVLRGCHTQGDTFDEAVDNIKDAIRLYIQSLIAHNEQLPEEDITIKPLRIAL